MKTQKVIFLLQKNKKKNKILALIADKENTEAQFKLIYESSLKENADDYQTQTAKMRKEIEQRENIISENKKDFDTQKVRFKMNLDSLDKRSNHMI